MKKHRRETEGFSLSFLDVICCGFGAVILLLMITKTVQPQILEQSTVNLEGRIAALQKQLFELRGETAIFNRDLNAKQEQLSDYKERIARLSGQLAALRSRFEEEQVASTGDSIIVEQLAEAKQRLTEEMKKLLGTEYQPQNNLIAGIPVDSEYLVFIIDSSGSMRQIWPYVITKINQVIDTYPEIKGLQVLDADGDYLYKGFRGKWLDDSPARRRLLNTAISGWGEGSFSNPAPGIMTAIRDLKSDDKKISIWVFADDYQAFTAELDRDIKIIQDLVSSDDGVRRVRIHGIGIRTPQSSAPESLALFMRELTYRNGGTFVGLNDYR